MIVEGPPDLMSVVGLMKSHTDWPEKGGGQSAPVFIQAGGGAEEILRPNQMLLYLKSPVIHKLGIMLDADRKPKARYDAIRKLCRDFFPSLPSTLDPDGVVVENDEGKRLGVWIMPDNSSNGGIEHFLQFLVPADLAESWDHAKDAAAKAKGMGCGYRESHAMKAYIYTWLAWQDPPGQSPGTGLAQKVLDPLHPTAERFADWFRRLYQLSPKTTLF
jgi:hypothetical protein